MEDVGGLENLKRWISKRNKSWLDSAQNIIYLHLKEY